MTDTVLVSSDEVLYTKCVDVSLSLPDVGQSVDIKISKENDTDGFIYDTIATAFMNSVPMIQIAGGRTPKYNIVPSGPDILISNLGMTEDEIDRRIAEGKYATIKPTVSFEITTRRPGSVSKQMMVQPMKRWVWEETNLQTEEDGVKYRLFKKSFDQEITFIMCADNTNDLWEFATWFEGFMDLNRHNFQGKGMREILFNERTQYFYRGIPLAKALKFVYSLRTHRWLMIKARYLTEANIYIGIYNALGIMPSQVLRET